MNTNNILQRENFYAHRKRLVWIMNKITSSDKCIDIGCGTGVMLTIPLALSGADIIGIDIAEVSIIEAKRLAKSNGLTEEMFQCKDIAMINETYDVVIVSEILEHLDNFELKKFTEKIVKLVNQNGILIVTVPNGRGTYERGQLLKNRKVWKYYESRVVPFMQRIFSKLKTKLCKYNIFKTYFQKRDQNIEKTELHMTFSDSKHIQFFSYSDIVNMFISHNFELRSFSGSAMFSGILINTFVRPYSLFTRFNCLLGDVFPKISAGYYFVFKNKKGNKNEI